MSAAGVPRVVVVTRPSDYEALLARHGTRAQARFFLETRGQSLDDAAARHRRMEDALARVSQAIPAKWRRSRMDRADLSRFVFEPGDVVVVVGQDGLVANVAKYLSGQLVVGGLDAVAALAHMVGQLAQMSFARLHHRVGSTLQLGPHQPGQAEDLGQDHRAGTESDRCPGL